MPTISTTTRATIKAYLEVFIENLVKEYRGREFPILDSPEGYLASRSKKGDMKPFHAAIIPVELLRINAFERGFSSSLGSTFEECARLIALDHHRDAQRGYDLSNMMSISALNEVERQVALFEHAAVEGSPRPLFTQMIRNVMAARREDDVEARTVRADLYIHTEDGTEFFFEMKSPKPNKGQCLEVTQRLLRFQLLRGPVPHSVQTFFAMAYNPYGLTRDTYKWSFARNYTPFDQALVIGHEFWEIVGGETTQEELLGIYQEVGREKSKYMLDALAFGF